MLTVNGIIKRAAPILAQYPQIKYVRLLGYFKSINDPILQVIKIVVDSGDRIKGMDLYILEEKLDNAFEMSTYVYEVSELNGENKFIYESQQGSVCIYANRNAQ